MTKKKNGVEITEGQITDLVFDDLNANTGTMTGDEMLENSIQKLGIGRGVVADKDNRLIGGNKTVETVLKRTKFKKVIFVDTDGETLVVTRRKDLSLDDQKGRELALADNRTGQMNLNWDVETLEKIKDGWGEDTLEDWGLLNGWFDNEDIEEVETVNEAVNFIIKCPTPQELDQLKKLLGVSSAKITYDHFVELQNTSDE